ncbi:hypothetical protein DYB34_011968 [Aphanomyces astaci]|uniref:Poly(A) RNA polymerase mitochondrial-like central palm domain-containing protein n=1 Tax=Aphanomyces astaci TaxID=112090 RepID=A0A3R7DQB4_APHAT|nr:hypothetical protein DYB34_011968 [Aphanomyces astaci]
MAPPSSWQPTQRGAKRLPPVQVYASSSDSEEYGDCMSHTGKKETKRQRSIWSDDDFDKNDDELYLHIQNGQGIDDAVPSRPRRKKQKPSDQPQRGLRHSHLWRSEFPPWLRKVDSNAMVCPNEELEHMATYLSVKPQEVQARRAIVRDISATIQAAFHQSHDLQFHLFGSLATATSSLATFRSDIDLTIQVVVPPSSANMVEYTSAAYDDDEGVGYPDSTGADQSYFDDHDADVDISGMQFNFITSSSSSHAPNSTPPSASASATNQRASSFATAAALNNKPAATSMSKAERSQCVRFLHKAARSLRQAHPSFQVEVRRLAKVPIINVVDEFLYQNAINKPYEGGIGSFRLYCMVTHVLATTPRKERGAPAALLLRFFQHFGCSQKFNNRTVLKLDLPHHDPPLRVCLCSL